MQGRGEESCTKEGEEASGLSVCFQLLVGGQSGSSSLVQLLRSMVQVGITYAHQQRRDEQVQVLYLNPELPSHQNLELSIGTSTDSIAEPRQYWVIPLRCSKLSVGNNKADCSHQRRHSSKLHQDTTRVALAGPSNIFPPQLPPSRSHFRHPVRTARAAPVLVLSCFEWHFHFCFCFRPASLLSTC
ncbi:hypothetical protein HDV57DRAFT_305198 [Trichoderma longibrachiatum]